MSASVLARLDRIESGLRDLGGELQAIRATVLAGSPARRSPSRSPSSHSRSASSRRPRRRHRRAPSRSRSRAGGNGSSSS